MQILRKIRCFFLGHRYVEKRAPSLFGTLYFLACKCGAVSWKWVEEPPKHVNCRCVIDPVDFDNKTFV